MAGSKGPRLGPAIYRAHDGVSDYACIITLVEESWVVSLTCFLPSGALTAYTRVKFDPNCGPQSAKPGTCYVW